MLHAVVRAADPPLPSPADYAQGIPWTVGPGTTETVSEIMARERAQGASLPFRIRERKPRRVLDTKDEGEALAPAVAQWPPAESPTAAERAPLPYAPQTVGTNFQGIELSESGSIPPDSVGDVGPTQILVSANSRIKVFDKSGALGGLDTTNENFFASVGGSTNGTSDPHIRFDRLSGRWFVTIIDLATVNHILIAVSSGPTITDTSSFTFFSFQHDMVGPMPNADTGLFADYDTLGVDRFALYVGVNMFNGNTFTGTTGFVINKANLLADTLTVTAFRQLAGNTCPGTGIYTPQGVHNDDPQATEGYLIGVDACVFSKLVLRRVIDPGGTPSISGNLALTVPTTASPIPQVQPSAGCTGPCPALDALDDRLFAASIHADALTGAKTLWTAHNIEVNTSGVGQSGGGRNGSRWYEIGSLTGTPALVQSGTLFDSAGATPFGYWIPSVAMSRQGHMAIGTSRASAAGGTGATSGHASIAAAGRLRTDSLGTTRAPTLAVDSDSSYNTSFPGTERWGDYSQTVVDPTDGQTMWTFQEYANATNSWGVRVIQLKAPPPATPALATPPTVAAGQASLNVTIDGTSASGSEFFDPGPDTGGPGFANRITAAIGGGVTVNSVTFVNPTQVTLNISTVGATTGAKDVTITNPDGQSQTGTGLLTVSGTNTAPTISDVPDQATAEDTPLGPIAFTVGDAETSAGSLTVSGSSSNTALVPNASIGFGGSGANRTVTITPAPNQSGTTTITITVSDGGLTAFDTFLLTVTGVNDPPTAVADMKTTAEDTPLMFPSSDLTANDSPGPASESTQTLTVIAVTSPSTAGGTVSLSSGMITYTPPANFNGTDTFVYTVMDNGTTNGVPDPKSAMGTVTVMVTGVNDAPTISDIPDQVTSINTSLGPIAFTVGDPETAAGSLTVSGSSSNTTLVPNANIGFGGSGVSRAVTITPAPNQSGTTTITITVSDGSLTVLDTFLLTVTGVNGAPAISNIPDQVTSINTSLGPIGFTVGDAETAAGSLTVSGSSSNTALVPNANIGFGGSGASRTVTVTPAPNQSGTTTITITVSDGALTASDTFVLSVNAIRIVTGAGGGGGPHVRSFAGNGTATTLSFFAYATGFLGGVRVAAGDVNGDGITDIVTAPGPGGGPHVRVFSGANPAVELASFFAYSPAFTGGVRVAVADVDGDGKADIITAAGPGGGPHVRVFSGANPAIELAGFFAYDSSFTGGVFVAGR